MRTRELHQASLQSSPLECPVSFDTILLCLNIVLTYAQVLALVVVSDPDQHAAESLLTRILSQDLPPNVPPAPRLAKCTTKQSISCPGRIKDSVVPICYETSLRTSGCVFIIKGVPVFQN